MRVFRRRKPEMWSTVSPIRPQLSDLGGGKIRVTASGNLYGQPISVSCITSSDIASNLQLQVVRSGDVASLQLVDGDTVHAQSAIALHS